MRRPKSLKRNDWRTWIGSPTAWLALFLSAGNAFYAVFFYSDHLICITQDNANNYRREGDKVSVSAPEAFVFVNSGTRPVAITNIRLIFTQPTVRQPMPSCDGDAELYDLKFQQTVLKPEDIITLSPKFNRPEEKSGTSDNELIGLWEVNASKVKDGSAYVVICATVTFVVENKEFRGTFKIGKVPVSNWALDGAMTVPGRISFGPATLLKRNILTTEVEPPLTAQGGPV